MFINFFDHSLFGNNYKIQFGIPNLIQYPNNNPFNKSKLFFIMTQMIDIDSFTLKDKYNNFLKLKDNNELGYAFLSLKRLINDIQQSFIKTQENNLTNTQNEKLNEEENFETCSDDVTNENRDSIENSDINENRDSINENGDSINENRDTFNDLSFLNNIYSEVRNQFNLNNGEELNEQMLENIISQLRNELIEMENEEDEGEEDEGEDEEDDEEEDEEDDDMEISFENQINKKQIEFDNFIKSNNIPTIAELKKTLKDIEVTYRKTRPGCKHYERNCQIKAPCCNKYFFCWRCHDEEVISHQIPRDKVITIKCLQCQLDQSPSESCRNCKIRFGEYFCSKCVLYGHPFIDTKENIFHCDECKLCRVGNPEDYYHCKCGLCISKTLKDSHNCIIDVSHNNCSICFEDLHSSRDRCQSCRCGHLIHSNCMNEMLSHGQYRCPTCMKIIISLQIYDRMIENAIKETPLPPEVKKKINILCYECSKYSIAEFHFIGNKCGHCQTYNTTQVKEVPQHRLNELEESKDHKSNTSNS